MLGKLPAKKSKEKCFNESRGCMSVSRDKLVLVNRMLNCCLFFGHDLH